MPIIGGLGITSLRDVATIFELDGAKVDFFLPSIVIENYTLKREVFLFFSKNFSHCLTHNGHRGHM
jgi:hypothetical protein